MAVPLSPLSATVTSRGGALGAEGSRQKIKKKKQKTHLHIYEADFLCHNCVQSLPVSHHPI